MPKIHTTSIWMYSECVCVCCVCVLLYSYSVWHKSVAFVCAREKGFTYKNYFVLLGFKLTILGTCWNSLASDLLATLVPFSFTIRSRDISGFFQFRHEFPVLQGEKCESPTANCTRKKPSLLRVGYIFFRVSRLHVVHLFIGVTTDISSSKLFPYWTDR